jgi:hypothetical protein
LLLVEWRLSYHSAAELTAGWYRDPRSDPEAASIALSVVSHRGRLDVAFIKTPAAFARQALDGYVLPGGSGFFWLTERHVEATQAAPADDRMFRFRQMTGPVARAGPASRMESWTVRLPHWCAATAVAAAELGALAPTWRRIKRRRRGLCLRCGYDLRFSAGRCPECGERTGSSSAGATDEAE